MSTASISTLHSFTHSYVRKCPRLSVISQTRRVTIQTTAKPSYESGAGPSIVSDSRYTGSSKLWADAEREDAEEAANVVKQPTLPATHENWAGEESIQDAVLRMLVDKYKPLREGTIRSADEKLKKAPPKISMPDSLSVRTIQSAPPLDASSPTVLGDDHKPWLVSFKPPSFAINVKSGNMVSTPLTKVRTSPLDEADAKKDRLARKRSEAAQRLTRARESTLDYRMGIKKGEAMNAARRNPVSLKGWSSLVEERIEQARLQGQFTVLKGRGKPLLRQVDERNPFIAREEFLMNRVIQRNGAAPPWVEVQGELETAVNSFRDVLRQSWTRRAVRSLTSMHPPALLARQSREDILSFRDKEWEVREQTYHDVAVAEVNSLVQKYNGIAPYPVRRGYLVRSVELERAYKDSAEGILEGIAARVREATMGVGLTSIRGTYDESEDGKQATTVGRNSGNMSVKSDSFSGWAVIRNWFRRTFVKPS